MPYQPGLSDVHIDAALTNLSTAYMQDASNFVSPIVFPNVPVNNKSDKYFTFAKDTFLRAGGMKTPFGMEANRGGFNLSSGSYNCDTYRWAFDLTPDVIANADSALNIDLAAVNFVMAGLMITREVVWASKYFVTGVWGTDVVGGTDFTQWNNQAASNPISDVKTARTTVLQNTGYLPNTLVVSQFVHDQLTQHPLILERYKYTSSDSITPQMLARLFEVERYVIATAVQATSQEGQTITTAFILGKSALLCYVPPAPGLMTPSSGYSFVWKGLTGLNDMGVATARIPMNWLGVGTERIEGYFSWDMSVVGNDLGYFFSSAVA